MTALPAGSSPTVVHTTLDVRGALTTERIVGFGMLDPGAPRSTILLRLLVQTDEGFDEVARKKVEQKGGGGSRPTRFSGGFPSPAAEVCKLVARFAGTSRKAPSRDAIEMPCARPEFPTGQATMTKATLTSGRSIPVEIADTDELRAFGLMYRRHLGAERGMAFEFPADTSSGFWMRNTLIPLSIAFYDSQGTIVRILDMKPCSEEQAESDSGCPIYDPGTTYRGALEVNRGMFEEWGIEEGDRIVVTR
ncbi:MAG TPA: DUF192 domain-containing protein [Actinomycetota bacterium]|nr:DUF192 domain-containing protein [Actinomycetota bacterium]